MTLQFAQRRFACVHRGGSRLKPYDHPRRPCDRRSMRNCDKKHAIDSPTNRRGYPTEDLARSPREVFINHEKTE